MENSFFTILFAVCGGMILYRIIFLIIDKFTSSSKPIPGSNGTKPSIATLLEEINLIIQLEVFAQLDVPQSIKDIPLISDFQELQQSIIHSVINSFSTRMWLEANKCGVTKKYIITYVTRKVQAEMISFMEQHNYSLNSHTAEEFMERAEKMRG